MNLPRRRKREPMGLREEPQIRCPAHLQFVRGFECLIAGKHECLGKIQAHHVSRGGDGGLGIKVSDRFTVPLCVAAHDEVHRGHDSFETKYKIDLLSAADNYWKLSRHRLKFEV